MTVAAAATSVKLPDNAIAEIRQTSLLGEKFVSLAAADQRRQPAAGSATATSSRSARTGRNPEVEEVLGALSLLLNGGGVAQLKTIIDGAQQGARRPRGRRPRRCSTSSTSFMGQLDANKAEIVRAIESLNRLAIALNKQKPAITQALDELPSALASHQPPARRPGQDAPGARPT